MVTLKDFIHRPKRYNHLAQHNKHSNRKAVPSSCQLNVYTLGLIRLIHRLKSENQLVQDTNNNKKMVRLRAFYTMLIFDTISEWNLTVSKFNYELKGSTLRSISGLESLVSSSVLLHTTEPVGTRYDGLYRDVPHEKGSVFSLVVH